MKTAAEDTKINNFALEKVYIPKKIHDISKTVYTSSGLRKNNFVGRQNIDGNEWDIWAKKGVEYLIQSINSESLDGKPPKISDSANKNLVTLISLIEQQQFNNKVKKAEARFTLKDYALLRGYSEERISKSGKFFAELKRDLISGAFTNYRLKIESEGKKGQLIGSFYSLFIPDNPKSEWKVQFNHFWEECILSILEKKPNNQFYVYHGQMISGKHIKPNIHACYIQLVSMRRANDSIPKKVKNFLKDANISSRYLNRSSECFKIIKEFTGEVGNTYPDLFEDLYLTNRNKKLPFNIQSLKDISYKDFKSVLKNLGEDDFREWNISFIMKQRKLKSIKVDSQDVQKAVRSMLDWIVQWEEVTGKHIRFTTDQRTKFLNDSVKVLGFPKVKEVYNRLSNATSANAFTFINVLTELMRDSRKKQ